MSLISRKPLRSQIRSHLVERLLGGDLEPGTQINESQLTGELGVSRTPLREALLQLEFEGLLESHPGKGFCVSPLDPEELEELFDVGIELEMLGILMGGGVSDEVLAKMEEIQRQREEIARNGGARDAHIRLDNQWHRLLVSSFENRQFQQLVRLVRNRLYRYVYAFQGDLGGVQKALRDHEQIMDALREGDLPRAAELLGEHGRAAQAAIGRLLEGRG